MSFTARDSTPIDVNGGGIGVDGNGWVGELVFKGLGTGGTFDASKVTITVSDPGFDSTGAAVTRTRTIKGGKLLRLQYPNQAQNHVAAVGSDVRIRFSLADRIFAGTTIVSVACAAGAYTGSNASSAATIVNSSTRAYPKPLFAWLNLPYSRETGSTVNVEAVAAHALARNGQMVACIKYTATDGTNTTAEVTSAAPTISAMVTNGNPPEAYKATLNVASLTNGALCTVNAKVYPWIGDASAVLNLATDGVALPTSQVQSLLPFLCDRTGAYGGAIAYVRAGASGGTVSATDATARAAPFPNMGAALDAIATWNNTNRGHNNHSGADVYLMDNGAGGAVQHLLTGSGAASGLCWTNIRPDPLAVGAVSLSSSGNNFIPELLRFTGGLKMVTPFSGFYILTNDSTTGRVALDNATIELNGARVSNFARRTWWRNVAILGSSTSYEFVDLSNEVVSLIGVTGDFTTTGGGGVPVYRTIIGCTFSVVYPNERTPSASFDSNDGAMLVNNKFLKLTGGGVIGYNQAYSRGIGVVQYLFEGTQNGPSFNIAADATTFAVDNVVEAYVLQMGDRGNRLYNDTLASQVAPAGLLKRGVSMFCALDNWNNKGDMIGAGGNSGSTGAWEYSHSVGSRGRVSFYGSKQGDTPASIEYYLGDYWEPGSDYCARDVGGLPTFVDNKARSTEGGYVGTGGGDYHLTGASNVLYNRVPSGFAALKFDMDGVARRNDGTGAAGVYERTIG